MKIIGRRNIKDRTRKSREEQGGTRRNQITPRVKQNTADYTQSETGRNQITPWVKQNTVDYTRSETDHNEVHPE